MKRLYVIVIAIFEWLNVVAQSVYMHEAQREAEESDGITLWGIFSMLFFVGVIYIIYYLAKAIKQDRDYKKKQVENNEAEVLRKEREAVEKRAYLDSLLKPEAIDLGLSLPILWSSINVGAKRNNILGTYFAWADTRPRLRFEHKKNDVCDAPYDELCNLFNSDKGEFSGVTEYDVARINFGDEWRVPTENEFRSLIDECKWQFIHEGNYMGWKVIGPNGNSIFLPMENGKMVNFCFPLTDYWTSTPTTNNDVKIYPPGLKTLTAIMLDIDQSQNSKEPERLFVERFRVLNGFIRPVKNKQ